MNLSRLRKVSVEFLDDFRFPRGFQGVIGCHGLQLGKQRFDLHVILGLVDHGEEADGVAVLEVCAEEGVRVDSFDSRFEHLDRAGIGSVDFKP